MIGFVINLILFMVNMALGFAFGFTFFTGLGMGATSVGAIVCLAIENA